jgi:competence protein ComFC
MNLDFFSDLLFPPTCLGCSLDLNDGILCYECQKNIELFNTLFCGSCSARLPELKKICHNDAPYILGAAARYDDSLVQNLIHTLKFNGVRAAAKPLGILLIDYVSNLGIDLKKFIVIPVPLSIRRHRGRGFNQSHLIAEYFAHYFCLPLKKDLLVRILHNKPQSETDDVFERRENIHGCFSLARVLTAENKNIILVDDVTTSGTTFNEAARILKAGGAKKIFAFAVARA